MGKLSDAVQEIGASYCPVQLAVYSMLAEIRGDLMLAMANSQENHFGSQNLQAQVIQLVLFKAYGAGRKTTNNAD